MEVYHIIIVGLIVFVVALVTIGMVLAYRMGERRRKDQQRLAMYQEANGTQQKLIYLLKSESA